MRAEFWAILAAVCWAAGALLEKKGIKIGHLSPGMGAATRTFFSLILLTALSYPCWGQLKTAGVKSISMIAIGGGIIAGGLGLMFLYAGLKTGNLSAVMVIAFCLTPVLGAILGFAVLKERLGLLQVIGMACCIIGAAMTLYFKAPPPDHLPANTIEGNQSEAR